MSDMLDKLVAEWSRLGAGFNAEPAAETPDLERLLLETAREAPRMPRLFIAAATWLHAYGELVAKSRLKRLIRDELAEEHRPVLGLLLDIAQQGTHPLRFQWIIRDLEPASPARPLFDVERSSPSRAARAERRASAISRRWGLWAEPIEMKRDALRPARWVMSRNPGFTTRADFRGDLRSSILASLRHDPGAGESELGLARAVGGSRAQVRSSLDNLEMTGRVARTSTHAARRVRIELRQGRSRDGGVLRREESPRNRGAR